jgi:hypothetical protein
MNRSLAVAYIGAWLDKRLDWSEPIEQLVAAM